MTRARIQGLAVGATAALAMLAINVVPAGATLTATATISAGSLAFVSTPGNLTLSDTLNGLDQTATTTQPLDIADATGSGTGWNLTATSTTFTSGGHTLSTTSTTATGATNGCDAGATCLTATNAITYPYALPAAGTAPTATKLFNAAANTGMGDQKVTPTWSLAIPADTYAGTYTSTWTISLVSGP